jgi:membrane protease YdiL (CAAX protease family)
MASFAAMVLGFSVEEMSPLFMLISSAAILVAAVGLTVSLFGLNTRRVLALRAPCWWQAAWAVLLVAPLSAVLQEIGAWAAEVLPSFNEAMFVEFGKAPWPLVFIGGCLLPGIGEEVFFRGFTGRGLVARSGLWIGVPLGALLFAAIHIDPVQMVGVVGIGVVLELVYLATKSLLVPMLLHTLNNTLSFAQIKYAIFADIDHVPPALVAAGAVALVPLAMLIYQTRSQWLLPNGSSWSPGYPTAESPPEYLSAQCRATSPSIVWLGATLVGYGLFLTVLVWAMQTSG